VSAEHLVTHRHERLDISTSPARAPHRADSAHVTDRFQLPSPRVAAIAIDLPIGRSDPIGVTTNDRLRRQVGARFAAGEPCWSGRAVRARRRRRLVSVARSARRDVDASVDRAATRATNETSRSEFERTPRVCPLSRTGAPTAPARWNATVAGGVRARARVSVARRSERRPRSPMLWWGVICHITGRGDRSRCGGRTPESR